MTLFWTLPSGMLVSVISEWCTVKNLTHLDSAACNIDFRSILLYLFKHHLKVVPESKWKCPDQFLEWIYLRELKLTSLIVRKISWTHFKRFLSGVQFLEFGECMPTFKSTDLVELLNSCPSLKCLPRRLDFEAYKFDILSTIDDSIVSQLTCVDLSDHNRVELKCLQYLADNCKNLTKVAIRSNNIVNETLFMQFLQNNPKISRLYVVDLSANQNYDGLFDYIATVHAEIIVDLSMPKLHKVDILSKTELLLTRCPNLQKLELANSKVGAKFGTSIIYEKSFKGVELKLAHLDNDCRNKLKNLLKLTGRNITALTLFAVDCFHIDNELFNLIALTCISLQTISFQNWGPDFKMYNCYPAVGILHMFQLFHEQNNQTLTSITLNDNDNMDTNTIFQIMKFCNSA